MSTIKQRRNIASRPAQGVICRNCNYNRQAIAQMAFNAHGHRCIGNSLNYLIAEKATTLAERCRAFRLLNKLTRDSMSIKYDVSKNCIKRVESGLGHEVSLAVVERISAVVEGKLTQKKQE